jgi:hypothetical protein
VLFEPRDPNGRAAHVGEQRLHVQALTTWQRWTQGHDFANNAVRTAFAGDADSPSWSRRRRPGARGVEQSSTPVDLADVASAQVGHDGNPERVAERTSLGLREPAAAPTGAAR